ncbi:hypothetical protein FRB99_006710, partial [Tulasnella sp. 403]
SFPPMFFVPSSIDGTPSSKLGLLGLSPQDYFELYNDLRSLCAPSHPRDHIQNGKEAFFPSSWASTPHSEDELDAGTSTTPTSAWRWLMDLCISKMLNLLGWKQASKQKCA